MKKAIVIFLLLTGVVVGCYYNPKEVITPVQTPTKPDTFTVAYTPASSTITFGTAGNSVKPTVINTVGGSVTYTLLAPPTGVSIDTDGTIKWANTVAKGSYTLQVTAKNIRNITDTVAYSLFVNNAGVSVPSSFLYSPATTSISTGTAGSSVAPSINSGGGTITYSFTPAVTGVSINSSTGVISWTNTVAAGNYTLTIKATNSAGSATTTYTLKLTAAVYVVSFSRDIQPVIASYCATCHHNTHTTWTTWSAISSSASTIYGRLKPVGNMPQGSSLPTVPTTQISTGLFRDLFNLWVTQGKQNN